MNKIKIYKSSNKVCYYYDNDRGFREEVSNHIYIYLYRGWSFFMMGVNDKFILESTKNFIINGSNIKYKFSGIPRGSVKGDLKNIFVVDFPVQWGLMPFKKLGFEYTLESIGLKGTYLDETCFKGVFYNCFSDIIFKEDTYELIYEGQQKIS